MKGGAIAAVARAVVFGTAAVAALQAGAPATPAWAQYSSSQSSVSQRQDAAITRAFRDVLKREPTGSELRRYRSLMREENWTEADVRSDLRSRSDYRRYSSGRGADPDRVIRRAYRDILDRDPDPEGLRHYRIEMIDNGWTEQDVREALRNSSEYARVRQASADRIVTRAYEDILGRQPDQRGLVQYRNRILNDGWEEYDVREALRRSPEYRQKNAMTREKAVEIVNRAYRSVLGRDGDPAGMEGYVQRVLRDKWTEADVARELRKSDEYKNKR